MGQKTTLGGVAVTGLHPEIIKARIRMVHGSVAAFEAEKGLPHRSVRDVLRGRSVRRAALALAEFLGEPVGKVFPGRFINGECKSPKGDSHRLNRQAA